MGGKEVEVLSISDGSSLQICRLVQLDEDQWRDLKDFLSASPGTAHALQGIASNAEALQGWLQLRAAAEHYQIKLGRNEALQHLSEALEADEELAPVFQDIRENGVQATLKYSDAALMVKISKKTAKLPRAVGKSAAKVGTDAISAARGGQGGRRAAPVAAAPAPAGEVDLGHRRPGRQGHHRSGLRRVGGALWRHQALDRAWR
mmetsp:Transcript_106958/g.255258  ORF Transcript_106958/g.255258 Transcript_106958/m.255258 type:complete len:204 (-) Transcript_106958:266-877(-)